MFRFQGRIKRLAGPELRRKVRSLSFPFHAASTGVTWRDSTRPRRGAQPKSRGHQEACPRRGEKVSGSAPGGKRCQGREKEKVSGREKGGGVSGTFSLAIEREL